MSVTAIAARDFTSEIRRKRIVPPLSLEDIEAYEFPEAVYKFVEYYDVDEITAESFFMETKRWLWLCATQMYEREIGKHPPELLITGSLFWLDEMWHTFLLFTEPYQSFCRDYLGRFVHHRPTTAAEKSARREEMVANREEFMKERADDLRRQCHYVCEKLGERTFVRWYREFAGRHSAAELFAKTKKRQPSF